LLAEPGIGAGHRAGHANPDLGPRVRSAECRNRNQADEQSQAAHDRPSIKWENSLRRRSTGGKA
jgi:hypothetical protein